MRIKYWAEYEPLGENCKFRDLPNRLDDTKIENQVTAGNGNSSKKDTKKNLCFTDQWPLINETWEPR